MGKKAAAKKAEKPAEEPTRVGGSTVPVEDRLWAHRTIDHKIDAERAAGVERRPPAVT